MIARRELLALIGAAPLTLGAARGVPFSFDRLRSQADALARQPFRAPQPTPGADRIDYDAANTISFAPARALFDDRPGASPVRLFPPRATAPASVALHLVENGVAQRIYPDQALFGQVAGVVPPTGASGFRVMKRQGEGDWLAFLGASYFRAVGPEGQYGLSARAVAVDAGLDGRESFPAFTAFWLEAAADGSLTIDALLDGEALTGAFRFRCRLTNEGVHQEVDAHLRLRRDVARIGLAPATSMFWYGQTEHRTASDWRPEVHDSDGLALLTGAGERLWRPLTNPPRPLTSSFGDRNPGGYGLLQRDRRFDRYLDDAVFYERRPDLWTTPIGSWGAGAVMLYAFPTRSEIVDNVVAFWTPAAPTLAGTALDYAYHLDWRSTEPWPSPLARVVDSYTGDGGLPGEVPPPGVIKIVVDFAGPSLVGLRESGTVVPVPSLGRGRIVQKVAYPLGNVDGRWRAMVDIALDGGEEPSEFRLVLERDGRPVSETLLMQLFG
ncbi:glucan biosynthesis protein D [Glacieibacterium sp.]|uniref:glucan biosynthesis protein D n=1 Tax=Glacieibacterium sp. TaxID=2860237 RepID=UPI003AFFFA58